ncbi:hypothetical protein AMECASPLE_038936, partial [Ameca splendens]
LCAKVTPLSLYMGEGMVELPEIDEELILSFKDASGQSEEASVKVKEPTPCSGLLTDQNPSCCEEDLASTDESTLQTSSPLAPSDLIQTRNTAALCQNETKVTET